MLQLGDREAGREDVPQVQGVGGDAVAVEAGDGLLVGLVDVERVVTQAGVADAGDKPVGG